MAVERAFKASKRELMLESLKWRGISKVCMHVAICCSYICAVAVVATRWADQKQQTTWQPSHTKKGKNNQ